MGAGKTLNLQSDLALCCLSDLGLPLGRQLVLPTSEIYRKTEVQRDKMIS